MITVLTVLVFLLSLTCVCLIIVISGILKNVKLLYRQVDKTKDQILGCHKLINQIISSYNEK